MRNLVVGSDLDTLLLDYNTSTVNIVLYGRRDISCQLGRVFVEWRSLKATAKNQVGEKAQFEGINEKKESVRDTFELWRLLSPSAPMNYTFTIY